MLRSYTTDARLTHNMNTPNTDKTVVVLMSGGVDSSVAAALLFREGYRVIGMTMKVVPDELSENNQCCSVSDIHDARRVAQHVGFPHYAVNVVDEFRTNVIEHFIAEYRRGRTPNPCMLCNEHLKFAAMWKRADALGADYIATGHYARVVTGSDGEARLLCAADPAKDQSYFLWGIPRPNLPHVLFPLGGLIKTETRALAREMGLPVAEKRDSQDICFVAGDYRELVAEATSRAGVIVDGSGSVLARHDGVENFTIGQRRGVGIGGAGEPLYVSRIDPKTATVTVGSKESLLSGGLIARNANFVSIDPPAGEITVRARIRSRHIAAPARAGLNAEGALEVHFNEPQESVTPGQGVALYDGDILLGGGVIDAALPKTFEVLKTSEV